MSSEFYKRFRPKTLKGIVGQPGAIASLQSLMDHKKLPHTLLLTGPSGCGKTTVARIVKNYLECGDHDYQEIDCAVVEHPLETVRSIQQAMRMSPIDGPCRVFFLEEAQSLSRAGFSQQAMLKMLEDTPSHVYFILATTNEDKLNKAILTRCTEIRLTALSPAALKLVIQRVIDKEQLKVEEDVIEEIVEAAEGSARKALVVLEQVGSLEDTEKQLAGVQAASVNKDQAILLARELFKPNAQWSDVAAILKELKDDPESIRYLVLGYFRTVLLGGGKFAPHAFKVIDIFSKNFYDSKHAGLAAACYEVVCMK